MRLVIACLQLHLLDKLHLMILSFNVITDSEFHTSTWNFE